MGMGLKQSAAQTITAQEQAATIGGIPAPGVFGVQITGTLSATITFEVSLDGTNWAAVELMPSTDLTAAALTSTATAAGVFFTPLPLMASAFRARCSSFTSATELVVRVMYAAN